MASFNAKTCFSGKNWAGNANAVPQVPGAGTITHAVIMAALGKGGLSPWHLDYACSQHKDRGIKYNAQAETAKSYYAAKGYASRAESVELTRDAFADLPAKYRPADDDYDSEGKLTCYVLHFVPVERAASGKLPSVKDGQFLADGNGALYAAIINAQHAAGHDIDKMYSADTLKAAGLDVAASIVQAETASEPHVETASERDALAQAVIDTAAARDIASSAKAKRKAETAYNRAVEALAAYDEKAENQ